MTYSLDNIRAESILDNPVKYSKIIDGVKWNTHKLENSFTVRLSNGLEINFEAGFTWDLASIPQVFQNILRSQGDDDIAYLIHDYLYQKKITSQSFADKEMLLWAKAMKQTQRISLRNIDIQIRYFFVRVFGKLVWNK